jgi:mRNA-degrading endonuclease toxin of MazEF toxin-antitoxin module
MLKGEIWWADLPRARGSEPAKTRPALIIHPIKSRARRRETPLFHTSLLIAPTHLASDLHGSDDSPRIHPEFGARRLRASLQSAQIFLILVYLGV